MKKILIILWLITPFHASQALSFNDIVDWAKPLMPWHESAPELSFSLTDTKGNIFTEIFEDVLHLNVDPQPATLLYSPVAQNLIIGLSPNTTAPYIIGGNPDISFGEPLVLVPGQVAT